jgi:hypothetical protein
MRKLVKQVSNCHHNESVKSILADGAYVSDENIKFLKEKRIKPFIKVKRNSVISSKKQQK